jgi:N-acetyl-gamma-glutamyl-phosphate reductase
VDVSADYRCDPAWQYGLTEVFSREIAQSRRVANPGCFATGVQLALWPIRQSLVEPAVAFGVSGYSGAGRTPSPRNDTAALADNLMPYQLVEHSHERETSRHLGRRVRLLPHVASFFRGISLTIDFQLDRVQSHGEVDEQYRAAFAGQPFVQYDSAIPEIRQVRDTPSCRIGGLQRDPGDPRRWVIASALDNLSKGAATQAIQNVNLMCGLEHSLGISRD